MWDKGQPPLNYHKQNKTNKQTKNKQNLDLEKQSNWDISQNTQDLVAIPKMCSLLF